MSNYDIIKEVHKIANEHHRISSNWNSHNYEKIEKILQLIEKKRPNIKPRGGKR
jgi:hypothetical protein